MQWSDDLLELALEDEDLEGSDEAAELADVLLDALDEDFSDATDDDRDDVLSSVLESMSPAESLNFTKALQQIRKGAGKALSDPVLGGIVRSGLPIAGAAAGTMIGGPLGTKLGSQLGTAATSALTGGSAARPTPGPGAQVPAAAGGSAAAAQGLVLTQQPDVLKSLLALAMGQHGQKTVNGTPVAGIMQMLSNVFGEAAADADELLYLDGEGFDEEGAGLLDDEAAPFGQSLYATLMDAENDELAEALESS